MPARIVSRSHRLSRVESRSRNASHWLFAEAASVAASSTQWLSRKVLDEEWKAMNAKVSSITDEPVLSKVPLTRLESTWQCWVQACRVHALAPGLMVPRLIVFARSVSYSELATQPASRVWAT